MKKNGFIFAETIIVITVLCFGLITIYNSFSLIVSNQKEELRYNNSLDINYLYLVRDFIIDTYGTLDEVKYNEDGNSSTMINIVNHNIGFFECVKDKNTSIDSSYYPYYNQLLTENAAISQKDNTYNMCASIHGTTGAEGYETFLQNVYFVKNMTGSNILASFTQEENDFINATAISYIKTITKSKSDNKYYIIGEFYRNGEYYYANLEIPINKKTQYSRLSDIVSSSYDSTNTSFSTAYTGGGVIKRTADINMKYSYYYRGNVSNNYVYFSGLMWRIVRVTGEGNIRLVLNDYAKNVKDQDYVLAYNSNALCASTTNFGSHDYVDTYSVNECAKYQKKDVAIEKYYNSSVAYYLDEWYNNNITGTNTKYVVYDKYCSNYGNDTTDESIFLSKNYTIGKYTPSLTCNFSVNTYSSGKVDVLTLKVGLLSGDELMFAGASIGGSTGYLKTNELFYLYLDNQLYWTMTPYYINYVSTNNTNIMLLAGGNSSVDSIVPVSINTPLKLRPVINLDKDVLVSGSGQFTDPYIVKGVSN